MPPDELEVRAATADDARFIFELRSNPDTSEFLAVSDQSEADLRAELDAAAEHAGRLIAERDGRRVAVLTWALINRRSRIAALSEVMVDPQTRGRGIAAALVRRASRLLVEQHNVHRIQLEVYGDNHAAQRAFERAGFQREGVRRRAYWRRDAWQDGIHYGLLADELP